MTSSTNLPVEGIFHVWRVILDPKQLDTVGLVLGPQQRWLLAVGAWADKPVVEPQGLMLALHVTLPNLLHDRLPSAALVFAAPDPRVPVPQRWQEVYRGRVWPTVGDGDPNE